MKRTYQQPETILVKVQLQQMIAGSPAGIATTKTMDFGDDTGDAVITGDSRRSSGFWDNED